MDHEILSRGKLWNSGEWVEGYYVHLYDGRGNESHRIYTGYAETDCGEFYPVWCEVDPATVGQYTGLTDKNDVKIFSGDIVRFRGKAYAIEYIKKYARFAGTRTGCIFASLLGASEVIGNVHDNPELMEGDNAS